MLAAWRLFTHWSAMPLRIFMWGCSYVFGHPMTATVLFLAVGGLAVWQRQWSAVAGCCAMLGLLLMWIAEFPGALNTAWPVRSPFAEPLPKEE